MTYPVVLLRIKAMMIDIVVLYCLFFTLVALASKINFSGPVLNVCFVVLPLILMEPLLIWLTGGSIGHHISGIRIIGKSSQKNLFVLNGIVRFIAKTVLGFYSLVAILITKQHQSVHDLLSHSVVVFKNEAAAPDRHKLHVRETTYTGQKPSVVRRLVVVFVYLVLTLIVLSILETFLLSRRCLIDELCSEAEYTYVVIMLIAFIVAVLLVIVLGFLSKLPGARYREDKS